MSDNLFLVAHGAHTPKQSRQRARNYKTLVLKRAKYRCEICGLGGREFFQTLNIHHIVAVSNGGHGGCSNLIALCPNCHALAHFLGHPKYRYGPDRFRELSHETQMYIVTGYRYPKEVAEKMIVFLTNEVAMGKHGNMMILAPRPQTQETDNK